uniref:cob(I)yrinic acid a,c-diamide adenosyltransferase n=1 Tax=Candidatus Electrothrix sp. TaxID=2170559 RepID=UPI004055E5DA
MFIFFEINLFIKFVYSLRTDCVYMIFYCYQQCFKMIVNNLLTSFSTFFQQKDLKGGIMHKKGLILIFTGHGKGKTTAALGMSIRAAGHGLKTCFIQFIKGSWKYGEMEALARFHEEIDFHVTGRGFTWKSEDVKKDTAAARKAWEKAKKVIRSGDYHTVVLDEFTYLLRYGMIDTAEVIEVLREKPADLHVCITGRDAVEELIELADLVTEMHPIKHPYQQGIKAQKGIEF